MSTCVGLVSPAATDAGPEAKALARQILATTGVKGGLIVHVGCGDGKLTAALRAKDSYLVHGLDADAADIEKARTHIQSLGLYGKVSVEQWRGERLPYADNFVNLLVADSAEAATSPREGGSEELGKIPMEEVMRVLAPRGVAYIRKNGRWTKAIKPWPKEMDEWTHYLHDAAGNAVARDTLVGPPRHMQWVAKPLYGRSHEIDTSVCALASARGRIFYILDEGLTGITDERLPERWSLVARDAFNGVLLWKRPIPRWGWREWKKALLAGKDWTKLRGQRIRSPIVLPRRLVAEGDRVYVTLGYRAPLTVLDAATGEIVRTCEGTDGTDEIVCSRGIVVLCVRKAPAAAPKQPPKPPAKRPSKRRPRRSFGQPAPGVILAIKADTGEVLWKTPPGRILPMSLAVGGDRVVFHNYQAIVCLNLRTGAEVWRAPSEGARGGTWGSAHTLVVHEDAVLFLGPRKLEALSAQSGKPMWTGPGGSGAGVANPPDLFVADGLVWCGRRWAGLDPITGRVKRKVEARNLISPGHHFRCYRGKATERYILTVKRGVEFVDLRAQNHMRHDWLRAPCRLGFMPCNGLLYVPPNQCFCYPGVRLNGFNALAAGRGQKSTKPGGEALKRLETGPAYTQIGNPQPAVENPDDWPTFRHDSKRSGSTASAVPVGVGRLWQAKLGGRITPAVVAGGKLFIGSVDAHRVLCLDSKEGKAVWSYTAGGRVDSPPTIHKGRVLFGSADGWVYCLRASDGELAWRFRAAPEERRVGAFGQLESAWPVHGSVLVKDDVAYFAAGRSTYLDGGIHVYGLDTRTGKKLHEARLDGPHPDLAKDRGRPFDMEGAQSDVLVTDGTFVYMRQVKFDSSLAEQETPRITRLGDKKVGLHLFATAGLLDDSWWNRTFWMHSARWPGYYIANQAPKAGQLLVFDATTTYGVKCYTRRNVHSPMFFPGTQGYLLFADENSNEPVLVGRAINRDKGPGFTRARPPIWSVWVPVRIRAMVLSGKILFVAGPPDVLDPDDPLAAFEGRGGALLGAVSAADGKKLTEYKLDSPPVFDGMIAANGRLYISTRDGRVLCMGKSQ